MLPMEADGAISGSPSPQRGPRVGAPKAPYDTGALLARSSHTDSFEIGNSQSHQNRHDERPGRAEPQEPFKECAKRPCQHDRLNSNVRGGVVNHPILETFEVSCEDEGVEND